MQDSVEVGCSARLHLGFLDLAFTLGRRFGSIGLALDRPRTRVVLRRACADDVSGPESARAARCLDLMRRHLDLPGRHALHIRCAIPAHSGLGSGTQLALAIAAALRGLHGLTPDPAGDARVLGRGARSGIGIGLFASGGLVVDGGPGPDGAPPPILARMAVPEAWRVLVLLDRAREGLSGPQEKAAFAALPPMADAAAGLVCRLVLMQALPALAESDLPGFGGAVTRIQRIVGDHFAAAQGGRFTSPRVAAALETLEACGATGLGQSSWGPTGFAFVASAAEADRLSRELARAGRDESLDILVCRALNRGAEIVPGRDAEAR